MLLADVVCQARIKTLLQNALAGERVAHAYLFQGPEGIGKNTLAKAFAGALLCGNGQGDACGHCQVCRRISEGNFPDFVEINTTGSNIKIEQIREIQKKAQFKPYESARKVFLINRAESMTQDSANSLLKILEEPPPHTIFLLIAVNASNLLPTIISRCQVISLSRVNLDEIRDMLVRNGIDEEKAAVTASLSDGLPGMALSMAQKESGADMRKMVIALAEQLTTGDINLLLKTAEEFEKKKELLPDFFNQLLYWFRDLLLLVKTGDVDLLTNKDKISELEHLSCHWTQEALIRCIEDILEAIELINKNVNLRLTLEVLLLKLARTA